MYYPLIKPAIFLNRPNRFIARVLIDDQEELVHVKNTGRCKELLRPGANLILEKSNNPKRKTKYSLIGVYKDNILVNIDSQAPNKVIYEGIRDGKIPITKSLKTLKREVTFGNSRFDLYFETMDQEKGFIEVKGVTLEVEGKALFPDAPTLRGTKHVHEMIQAVKMGFHGFIIFLIQMKGPRLFTPNWLMDEKFSQALADAKAAGVNILVYDAQISPQSILLGEKIDYTLSKTTLEEWIPAES